MTILSLPSVNGSPVVEYRMHHGYVQRRELSPSGAEYGDDTSQWRDVEQAHIDTAYAQRTPVADWLDQIATSDAMIAVVRGLAERRYKISRDEMRDVLLALAPWVELGNGWAGSNPRSSDRDNAAAWAAAAQGITVISVLAPSDSPTARYQSSNPGAIRFDEPGSMHPQMRATLMFVSADAAEREQMVDYLRDRTKRLFVVREDEHAPED